MKKIGASVSGLQAAGSGLAKKLQKLMISVWLKWSKSGQKLGPRGPRVFPPKTNIGLAWRVFGVLVLLLDLHTCLDHFKACIRRFEFRFLCCHKLLFVPFYHLIFDLRCVPDLQLLPDMTARNRIKLDLPDEVRRFTNAELQAATMQMSKSLMLGMGGFGPVFRLVQKEEGKCAKVGISVASKGTDGVGQGKEEFANEAKLLYLWQHARIVPLLGVCEGPVPCIVYEHLSRGSLAATLQDDEKAAQFKAVLRLQVAIDVADALDFLHEGGRGPQPSRNTRVAHAVVLHR